MCVMCIHMLSSVVVKVVIVICVCCGAGANVSTLVATRVMRLGMFDVAMTHLLVRSHHNVGNMVFERCGKCWLNIHLLLFGLGGLLSKVRLFGVNAKEEREWRKGVKGEEGKRGEGRGEFSFCLT